MKPPPFVYRAPTTVAEIVALLATHGADARVLAGGQSLIPLINLRMARPQVLIDLNRCPELTQIESRSDGVHYGAMVRQRVAERSEMTRTRCPLVAKALARTGPVAVRNRATVGGTLAHADRVAELPGVAMALDAIMVLESTSGQRRVPAEDFFLGDLTTAIEPQEMLRAVEFPEQEATSYTEFLKVGLRKEGVAIVGLAALISLDSRRMIRQARLAVTGVEPRPVRLKRVEAELRGRELDSALISGAGDLASECVDPLDDPFVKARYRKFVTGSLVKRALHGAAAGGRP
jgi:carbon-monoxide dehydrogenase medium subunit